MDPVLIVVIIALLAGAAGLALAAWLSVRRLQSRLESLGELNQAVARTERLLLDELARNRQEAQQSAQAGRSEIAQSTRGLTESFMARMTEVATLQKQQLDSFANQLTALTRTNLEQSERLRGAVDVQLKSLREDNARQLEQMRVTVDEKLQTTLQVRLSESFRQVSERLEQVHKGLGEMNVLAAGVGDLKKVLTNVKTRGTWGEIQLGNLLEQVLAPEQYEANVATKAGSAERVEFAIRLPGREGTEGRPVWLPVDAKFPQEDYQRLVEAQEAGEADRAEAAGRELEKRIRLEARQIREKYLDPPGTTDFAIMFLPTEGLFAEVIRRPGLCEVLQRDHRVVVAGPTTLAALLNSLQMGFRTMAIEQRSREVWALLGTVKKEFGKFGGIIGKVQKKLQEASNTIEDAARKTRTIERRLKAVEALPAADSPPALDVPKSDDPA
jgi:DNA recombination protein RmuC